MDHRLNAQPSTASPESSGSPTFGENKFDKTKLPVDPRHLKTTIGGRRSLFQPPFDRHFLCIVACMHQGLPTTNFDIASITRHHIDNPHIEGKNATLSR